MNIESEIIEIKRMLLKIQETSGRGTLGTPDLNRKIDGLTSKITTIEDSLKEMMGTGLLDIMKGAIFIDMAAKITRIETRLNQITKG